MAEHSAYWPFEHHGPVLAPEPVAARSPSEPPRALAGQRLRLTVDNPFWGPSAGPLLLAPPDQEHDWRAFKLDSKTLDRMQPAALAEMVCTLSPDISKALWDFLRFCNPGFEVQAFKPGTETVDKQGTALVKEFLATLEGLYGSVDIPINRLFVNTFLRGGMIAELVLDKSGRKPIDLAVPDARWIYFRRLQDPERGFVWQPYQYQGAQQVPLDKPTIRYVPLDPFPGSPYGRSIMAPALFLAIFSIGLLHDLRRVVAQQGYPRLDVAINLERLLLAMPPDQSQDLEARRSWLNSVVDEVSKTYQSLEPDDAYVHLDSTTVGRPVGAIDSSSLGAVDGLLAALDRMSARALKSNALLMGIPEGMSEANANRQWESFSAGIKAVQHPCESLLGYLLTLALQAQGRQARVELRFAELRASEMLRDSQTEALKLKNAALAYALGYISQDEAANMALQKVKADQAEPRIPTAGIQGGGGGTGNLNPDAVQPEPGVNRMQPTNGHHDLALLPNGNGHGS
jgi:hypothetical protein